MSPAPDVVPAARPLVVVVHWGSSPPTLRLLEELTAPGELPFEILVFANQTADEALLARFRGLGCAALGSRSNLGYGGAVNAAVAAMAPRPAYLILNNDLHCSAETADALLRFVRDAGVGAAGPVTLDERGVIQTSGVDIDYASPLVVAHRSAWPTEVASAPAIQGSALAFSQAAFERAGPWDESFFYGWEETDWCLRLGARGLTCNVLPSCTVRHVGTASLGGPDGYNPIVEYMLVRNLFSFVERWAPAHLDAQLRYWTGAAGTRTVRQDEGVSLDEPELARRVTLEAIAAYRRGEVGIWPGWLEAIREQRYPMVAGGGGP